MTEEKRKSFEEAAKPMIKWLNENCHPHMQVLINCTDAELLEGQLKIRNEEFVRD